MYSMLIVDDEPEIVENLYELFKETAFPQLDIHKAYSSREALLIVNTMKIDILLTDIRMPGVNGLQLAEITKNNWPKSRIVFLTGYNEFEYAYSAIKGDCEDYLLKTESNKEIITTIEKTLIKMEKSLEDEELIVKARNQMKFTIPFLQRKYILDIAKGLVKPSEINQKKFDKLEIELNADFKVFMLIGRIDETNQGSSDESFTNEYMTAVKVIMEEALSRYNRKIIIEYDNTSFLCLIQEETNSKGDSGNIKESFAEDMVIIKGTIETIQNICRKSFNRTVSFVQWSEAVDWNLLSKNFLQLKKILNFSSGIGKEALLTDKSFSYGIFEKISSDENKLLKNDILNVRNISTLANNLERGLKEEYYVQLSQIIDCLKNITSKNNNLALEIYYTVSNCLLSYINRWMIAEIISFKTGLYKLTRVDLHDSWSDAVDYLYALSKEIFDTQKNTQDKAVTASIKNVQQYIHNHLNEDLSLVKLSDLVYFNPSYLSRLFKQVTGTNLSEYITEARITKAKTLLSQNEFKVHELAQIVGLESPIYFARIFKKATNMTPQEYREYCYKR